MAKLTVKSLAIRVALLERIITALPGVAEIPEYEFLVQNNLLFGPAVEHKKILKTLSDKQKDNEKKDKKKAKKKAEKEAKLNAKIFKKANKKLSKMTKTKIPEKGSLRQPPVNLAPLGHPGHEQH